ncbi:hypothetical protein IJI31_03820 [bacterium]|nr:hypothetical protein [bacterium]
MSASQVRYLTLTARIHDVENQAQRIQNQKLLLANDSDEVYQRYLDALERTKIQVRQFADDSGISQMVDVNLNILYRESCSTFTNGYMLTGVDGTLYLPFQVNDESMGSFDNFLTTYKGFLGVTEDNDNFRKNHQQQYNYALGMWRYINEQAGTSMFAIPNGESCTIYISDDAEIACSPHGYDDDSNDSDGTTTVEVRKSVIHCDVPTEYLDDTNWIRDIIGYGYANFQMMSDGGTDLEVDSEHYTVSVQTATGMHPLDSSIHSYTVQMHEFASSTVSTDTQMGEAADEVELAKAEVEYESDMKKINAKDKRYDTELSTLENQRSAMKEEMESMKTVIKENIDRTFKIFS